jgi:hypothetical protein
MDPCSSVGEEGWAALLAAMGGSRRMTRTIILA